MEHSTISSFCMDPTAGHVRRVVAGLSCMLGMALSALLLEERELHQDQLRFWLALSASMALPLVGIFPSYGVLTGPEARKAWLTVGKSLVIPMVVPTLLHCFGALYFMIAHIILNMIHSVNFFYAGRVPATQALLGLSIISVVFMFGLLSTQAVIILKGLVALPVHVTSLMPRLPSFLQQKLAANVADGKVGWPEEVTYYLHSASFVSEMATLTTVTLTTLLLCSVKRHDIFWQCLW